MTTSQSDFKTYRDYRDQDKLKQLSKKVMLKIDDLLSLLGVEFEQDNKKYYGECPIHGGDNIGAINLYHNNSIGHWQCHTQSCEKVFISSIIGFTRGVLSHKEHSWESPGDDTVGFNETVDYLLAFINEDYDNLKTNLSSKERDNFSDCVNNVYAKKLKLNTNGITKNTIRSSLQIPANYYVNRGYSDKILDTYDVGLCNNKTKLMYNRVVVPIYDDEHKYMVSCTGRSIFDKCPHCSCFHGNGTCPENGSRKYHPKWLHSKGFKGSNYLYNYWNSKKHIKKTNVAILVESPGNVWRLEEAGIHNSVGLFGTSLSGGQRMILDGSGAMSLILILDNDHAGKEGEKKIRTMCERVYNIYTYIPQKNDLGEMTIEDIQTDIYPIIEKIRH